MEKRMPGRATVRLHGERYFSLELLDYYEPVNVSLREDGNVDVYDMAGRLITIAVKERKTPLASGQVPSQFYQVYHAMKQCIVSSGQPSHSQAHKILQRSIGRLTGIAKAKRRFSLDHNRRGRALLGKGKTNILGKEHDSPVLPNLSSRVGL